MHCAAYYNTYEGAHGLCLCETSQLETYLSNVYVEKLTHSDADQYVSAWYK